MEFQLHVRIGDKSVTVGSTKRKQFIAILKTVIARDKNPLFAKIAKEVIRELESKPCGSSTKL